MPKRKHKGGPEITFDPEARRSYLRGFSERKKQRRAYGLAMQKVKDRQEKLSERKERKQSLLHQIEQSEKAKEELLKSVMEENNNGRSTVDDDDDDDYDANANDKEDVDDAQSLSSVKAETPQADTKIQKYDDKETEKRWGGQVVVTTSTEIPGDDSSDDDDDNDHKPKARQQQQQQQHRKGGHKDRAQEYAGSVDRFFSQTVKALPAKHHKGKNRAKQHKGKHGASDMKGVGGAAGLQAAQKILKRSQGNSNKKSKREGKKGKRR